jgi:hypothetical protein
MSEPTHRGLRCGLCYWALYDGDWCQNSDCKLHGQSVGDERVRLTTQEALVLIKLMSKGDAKSRLKRAWKNGKYKDVDWKGGEEDHFAAKIWKIRSQKGVPYECSNLCGFIQKNIHLFEGCEEPGATYKTPLWKRAAMGIMALQRKKKASHHWRGWTLVSCIERDHNGGGDLMDRDIAKTIQ